MISDGSFPKKERLAKTGDFRRVYKGGSFFKAGNFTLYAFANGLEHNRIGFSLRAQHVRPAARRNRIKRLLRESYRNNKSALKKGFDIVVTVKSLPKQYISYGEVEEIFMRLAKKVNLTQ